MKDESGHFGDTVAPQAPTYVEHQDALAAQRGKSFGGLPPRDPGFLPSRQEQLLEVIADRTDLVGAELISTPTAWKSVPGAVRFAVWLWAIAVIIGFVVGAVLVLLAMISGTWVLSQM